jgi:hypothetical protein
MADAVTTNVVFSGTRRRTVTLTNISDGTGESAVVKVDVSALTGPDGSAPTEVVIEEISWDIQGFTSIRLLWDADTDDVAVVLGPGTGYMSWKDVGGLKDPQSTGATGDLVLTTNGHSLGDTYTITMVLRLKD